MHIFVFGILSFG